MGDLMIFRTPELIAAEINSIKEQTRKMVLYNSIEIGRRLVEAKELVGHGEWGKWLEETVDYSQSTANNLMKIFWEYGTEQLTLLGDNAKSQAFGNLSYSQAVALLGIPAEERESFMEENNVENMTTRELQQAIKAKQQAEKEKDEAVAELAKIKAQSEKVNSDMKKIEAEKERIQKELKEAENKNKKELETSQKELKSSQKKLDELNKKIKDLENRSLEVQHGATPEEVAKIKADAEAQHAKAIATLRAEKETAEKRIMELEIKTEQQDNMAVQKYTIYFEELVKNFKNLLTELNNIKQIDKDTYKRYRNAVLKLFEKLAEPLKVEEQKEEVSADE